MPIITLTTDYGLKDHYVAVAKAILMSKNPLVQLVDVTHCIECYDIGRASYVVSGAYPYFPKDTIHLIAVDAELHPKASFLVMKMNDHYFVAPDNGTLSLVQEQNEGFEWIVRVHSLTIYAHLMDLYAEIVLAIHQGTLAQIGEKVERESCVTLRNTQPQIVDNGNAIRGNFMHEDHYGNLITNVSLAFFEKVGQGRPFTFSASRYSIQRIHQYYADFDVEQKPLNDYMGQALLLFNSENFLQIAIYKGSVDSSCSVNTLLNLSSNDTFIIQFN